MRHFLTLFNTPPPHLTLFNRFNGNNVKCFRANAQGIAPKAVRTLCVLFLLFTAAAGRAGAQSVINIQGRVTDAAGDPLAGVTIMVKDASVGAVSGADGSYSIAAPNDAVLVFSQMGMASVQEAIGGRTAIDAVLTEDALSLDDVVIIGYGQVKKKDLTGSVTTVQSKDFQQGQIASPDRLIMGRVAGVQITPGNGAPGSGSRIRIRGGASLNASNDPLIVLDGVPLDNSNVSGAPSVLSAINPADIESMNVLKDASATAIYGSRASNGVIIITTKKGEIVQGGAAGSPVKVAFSTQGTLQTIANKLDLLTGDQIREIVRTHPRTTAMSQRLVGAENTDWQDQIYQTAFGTDNNLSVTGRVWKIPFRVSGGYFNQDGTLKTGNMQRTSGAVNLNPKFFDNRLQIDLNVRASNTQTRYANTDAIGSASRMDPTQKVRDEASKYGGYFEWDESGAPNTNGTRNPLAQLMLKDDRGTANRLIGNVQADYRFAFLPALRANVNAGYDYSNGYGKVIIPAIAAMEYNKGGRRTQYDQSKTNAVWDSYLNYKQDVDAISSSIDLMAGYTYQDWKTRDNLFPVYNEDGTDTLETTDYPFNEPRHTLVSFYGRLNYALLGRYLLTATARYDGSSRFAPQNRWGLFPSVALAWRIKDEAFLRDVALISDLKLRLGYGATGQQDGIADYSYLPVYQTSTSTAQYQLGDKFYTMYRPNGYDANIKWESTTTYNAGVDFGLLGGRLSGGIDVYLKKTSDLLSVIPVAAGSNFVNELLTNIGSIENRGVELNLAATPILTADWEWDVNFNFTYNKNKVTKLTQVEDPNYAGVLTGNLGGGTGNKGQIHSVGYNTFAYYLHKQIYDQATGKPIEGLYADLNGDGIINEKDLYRTRSAEPHTLLGFSTTLRWRGLSLSTGMRASVGNWVFNNVASDGGSYRLVMNPLNYVQNAPASLLKHNFYSSQYLSDYWLEDGSFLKMDYLTLAYNFGQVWQNVMGISVNFSIQNVFTLTRYTGLDPEIAGGIDNNLYPRPRAFTLGISFNFF